MKHIISISSFLSMSLVCSSALGAINISTTDNFVASATEQVTSNAFDVDLKELHNQQDANSSEYAVHSLDLDNRFSSYTHDDDLTLSDHLTAQYFSIGGIFKKIKKGFQTVSLGPRILRTETAALVAMTALQCKAGDL